MDAETLKAIREKCDDECRRRQEIGYSWDLVCFGIDLTEKAVAEEILEAWFNSGGSEKEYEKQAKKFGVD